MEGIVIILIGLAVYAAIAAPIKRSKHRAHCPKCGTECKASPWGTSNHFEAKYKCPNCGHKFTSFYSRL
jgi:transposase-like protein